MGDFKALRASRKLSLMWADRFKRTRLFCFLFGAMPKRKSKIGLLTFPSGHK
jgi:hypothetical protein